MKRASILLVALMLLASVTARAEEKDAAGPYKLASTFQVGGEGGWDYLTVDAEHHLLFVPRSTHTQVLDEQTGKQVADIPGQSRNHGVALAPQAGRGFITDGKDASVTVFDLKDYQVLGKVKTAEDADGAIFDPASGKVFVVCGDAGEVYPIAPDVDPKNGKADEALKLGGKPEFLASDGQGKVFINLVDKGQVAVVDTRQMKVTDHWSTAPGGSPVGMAIDRDKHRLFIGCRKPQKLIVMSTDDGKVIADLPIGQGVDATQFDDGYALASCADGTLAVARETSDGKFEIVQTVPTKRGARTMGLDPTTHTLYLPTAEYQPQQGQGRPQAKPGTFMVLVVKR
jgi:DNA-binding beta-propeller fold protein YncE